MLKNKCLTLLEKAIYWEIILIPFVASFSSAAVNVFIGLLIATFIIKRTLSGDFNIFKPPLSLPFGLLFIFSLFSIFNSTNYASSIQGLTKLIKYGSLIFILASEIKDKAHVKKIVIASLFGLLLASLDGIYQLIFGVDFFRHKPYDTVLGLARLKAAFPHTNIFAGYLALFVPVALIMFRYYLKGKKQIITGIISFLGLFCLVFTFSRSAVFGVWLGLFLVSLTKKDWLPVIILMSMVLIAPFIAPKGISDWTKSTSSTAELLLNKERFALYETSLNMIRQHPLMGIGVNTYCINYQRYKLHDTVEGTEGTQWYAHNSYLQMASEIGLFCFFSFLYLLFKIFNSTRQFVRKSEDGFLKISSLGLLIGIFAFLIHGLTESNLYYPKIAVLFWFQVALLARVVNTFGTPKGGLSINPKESGWIDFKKEGENG